MESACVSPPILDLIAQKDYVVIIVITEETVNKEFVNVTQVNKIKNIYTKIILAYLNYKIFFLNFRILWNGV